MAALPEDRGWIDSQHPHRNTTIYNSSFRGVGIQHPLPASPSTMDARDAQAKHGYTQNKYLRVVQDKPNTQLSKTLRNKLQNKNFVVRVSDDFLYMSPNIEAKKGKENRQICLNGK